MRTNVINDWGTYYYKDSQKNSIIPEINYTIAILGLGRAKYAPSMQFKGTLNNCIHIHATNLKMREVFVKPQIKLKKGG